jgi:hypothetical protein
MNQELQEKIKEAKETVATIDRETKIMSESIKLAVTNYRKVMANLKIDDFVTEGCLAVELTTVHKSLICQTINNISEIHMKDMLQAARINRAI